MDFRRFAVVLISFPRMGRQCSVAGAAATSAGGFRSARRNGIARLAGGAHRRAPAAFPPSPPELNAARLLPALLALLALVTFAAPTLAHEAPGEILAYDRQANIPVFTDRTVWQLGAPLVPGDLDAGDVVTLTFRSSGDNCIKTADAPDRVD